MLSFIDNEIEAFMGMCLWLLCDMELLRQSNICNLLFACSETETLSKINDDNLRLLLAVLQLSKYFCRPFYAYVGL